MPSSECRPVLRNGLLLRALMCADSLADYTVNGELSAYLTITDTGSLRQLPVSSVWRHRLA